MWVPEPEVARLAEVQTEKYHRPEETMLWKQQAQELPGQEELVRQAPAVQELYLWILSVFGELVQFY